MPSRYHSKHSAHLKGFVYSIKSPLSFIKSTLGLCPRLTRLHGTYSTPRIRAASLRACATPCVTTPPDGLPLPAHRNHYPTYNLIHDVMHNSRKGWASEALTRRVKTYVTQASKHADGISRQKCHAQQNRTRLLHAASSPWPRSSPPRARGVPAVRH